MEPNVTREFDTQAEADAFIDGINYCNDDTTFVLGTREIAGGRTEVLLYDQDAG